MCPDFRVTPVHRPNRQGKHLVGAAPLDLPSGGAPLELALRGGGRCQAEVVEECACVRTKSWTGPPRAGEDGGEEVIHVDIRHEPVSGKTSLKRIPLTCGIKYGYPKRDIAILLVASRLVRPTVGPLGPA